MTEVRWADLAELELHSRGSAITIGVFDGIHRGHAELIRSVVARTDLVPVVFTFSRHPTLALAAGRFPGLIMSLEQRLQTIADLGVSVAVLIDFSDDFSRMSGAEFLQSIRASMNVEFAAIGYDFRCGRDPALAGSGVRDYLREHDVAVELMQPVFHENAIVSSTRIRTCIREGRLTDAAALLGRPYSLDVAREIWSQTGQELTLRLDDSGLLPASRQIAPMSGKYAAVAVPEKGKGYTTTLEVADNSLRMVLADASRIRYIVLTDNRVK